MSKELLSIDNFSDWIINDDTLQTTRWFADMSWLDVYTEDWMAQPYTKPAVETFTSLNENPNGFIKFDWRMLAWMDDEEIWSEATANTWTLLHTNANAWDNLDITTYQNHLIFASNTRLWRSTNTTIAWGFSDSPAWVWDSTFLNWTANDPHFFKNFNNRLYISDWNVIAELDWASDPTTPANWVFTDDIFKLTEWEVIKTMEVIWSQLAIWTESWTLFIWDWASANASAIIPAQFWGITAMVNVENTLFVFAWVNWTVYRYNWTDLVPVIQIPNVVSSSSWTFVRKNGVKRYKNWMMFALPLNALYVFNRVKEWQPFTLTKYWNLSWWQDIAASAITVFSLFVQPWTVVSWDTIFIGYDVSWTEKIDRITDANWLYTDALLETVEYFLRDKNWKPNKVQWVQLKFRDLISSDVTVKYKADYNTSFTTLWTISHTWFTANSKEKILRWIGQRVDKIVFKLEWVNWKLINIKIF